MPVSLFSRHTFWKSQKESDSFVTLLNTIWTDFYGGQKIVKFGGWKERTGTGRTILAVRKGLCRKADKFVN
jgi:hypothetical protein